jgi:hypothetical protein
VERLDDRDRDVLCRLGYAMARAQLWELAMLKLIEAQRHDVTVPLDDRWDDVKEWLKLPAGRAAGELGVPAPVAADLRAIVERRNLVAHHAWRFYIAAREKRGEAAADAHAAWLDDQARTMGFAYNGVMALVQRTRRDANASDDALVRLWRRSVRAPIPSSSPLAEV